MSPVTKKLTRRLVHATTVGRPTRRRDERRASWRTPSSALWRRVPSPTDRLRRSIANNGGSAKPEFRISSHTEDRGFPASLEGYPEASSPRRVDSPLALATALLEPR